MSRGGRILTIGHSSHEPERFLELLEENGAELLADVRRHPGSRRVPWTKAESLPGILASRDIGYEHLPELGGRRRPVEGSVNDAWEVAQFRGYADHMATSEFAAALARLEGLARERRAAIMCAEAQWWRCHRRLVSDALLVRGWRVLHIHSRGGTDEHELTAWARPGDDGTITYPAAESLDTRA